MDELLNKLIYVIDRLASSVEMLADKQETVIQVEPVKVVKGKTKKVEIEETPKEVEIEEETKEQTKEETKEETTEKGEFTLDGIRAKCADLTRAGKREQIKKLLNDFKVENLTSLNKDDYADFMEEVSKI